MKWGVRNPRRKAKTPTQTARDYKRTLPYRGKHPSELTNKQLKEVNERLNLEQNYNRLNPKTVARGVVIAGGVLTAIKGAQTAYNMLNSPAGKAAVAAGKQMLKYNPRIGQQKMYFPKK